MTNDQGQEIKNSDAVRARNARKRAKLKAKARGESPHAYSFRMVAKTRDIWAQRPEENVNPSIFVCAWTTRYTTWNSATINSTGHELTDHGRTYIRTFLESLTYGARLGDEIEVWPEGYKGERPFVEIPREPSSIWQHPFDSHIDHFTVYIIRDGEERSTTWQDVTDVETLAAEVEAAFLL